MAYYYGYQGLWGFGQGQLGQVRFGQAGLGQFRLGKVRIGQARLSQVKKAKRHRQVTFDVLIFLTFDVLINLKDTFDVLMLMIFVVVTFSLKEHEKQTNKNKQESRNLLGSIRTITPFVNQIGKSNQPNQHEASNQYKQK